MTVHTKPWVWTYHATEMEFTSTAWQDEALWVWMFNMSLSSGLFQLLEGHVTREIKHGSFESREEASSILKAVSKQWALHSRWPTFAYQLSEISFRFVFLLPALMRSADVVVQEEFGVCVRLFSHRSSALIRHFLSFSACSSPST